MAIDARWPLPERWVPLRAGKYVVAAALAWFGVAAADSNEERIKERALMLLLDRIERAIDSGDAEDSHRWMQPDAVVIGRNADVSRGAEQIRTYFRRKGESHAVRLVSSGPAIFYSDSAVAYGAAPLIDANWTATMVRTNGEWKLASLHFSNNLFDNPPLNRTKHAIWIAGLGAASAGLLLVLAGSWWLRKRRVRRRAIP